MGCGTGRISYLDIVRFVLLFLLYLTKNDKYFQEPRIIVIGLLVLFVSNTNRFANVIDQLYIKYYDVNYIYLFHEI